MSTWQKHRPCPPNELGEPKRKFSETFSAVTLFERKYFEDRRDTPPLPGESNARIIAGPAGEKL